MGGAHIRWYDKLKDSQKPVTKKKWTEAKRLLNLSISIGNQNMELSDKMTHEKLVIEFPKHTDFLAFNCLTSKIRELKEEELFVRYGFDSPAALDEGFQTFVIPRLAPDQRAKAGKWPSRMKVTTFHYMMETYIVMTLEKYLLRLQSPKVNVQDLCFVAAAIADNDYEWMQCFIELMGLNLIVNVVNKKQEKEKSIWQIFFAVLECLQNIIDKPYPPNSIVGLDICLQHKGVVNILVHNMEHPRLEVREKAIGILAIMFIWCSPATACNPEQKREARMKSLSLRAVLEMYRAERGYESVWSIFIRGFKSENEKFKEKNTFDMKYLSDLVNLLNLVLETFEEVHERISERRDMGYEKFPEVVELLINNLSEYQVECNAGETELVMSALDEIQKYADQKHDDNMTYGLMNTDLHNAKEVFDFVNEQAQNCGCEEIFARVLKSLIAIDPRNIDAPRYWEECANLLGKVTRRFAVVRLQDLTSLESQSFIEPEIAHELKRYVPLFEQFNYADDDVKQCMRDDGVDISRLEEIKQYIHEKRIYESELVQESFLEHNLSEEELSLIEPVLSLMKAEDTQEAVDLAKQLGIEQLIPQLHEMIMSPRQYYATDGVLPEGSPVSVEAPPRMSKAFVKDFSLFGDVHRWDDEILNPQTRARLPSLVKSEMNLVGEDSLEDISMSPTAFDNANHARNNTMINSQMHAPDVGYVNSSNNNTFESDYGSSYGSIPSFTSPPPKRAERKRGVSFAGVEENHVSDTVSSVPSVPSVPSFGSIELPDQDNSPSLTNAKQDSLQVEYPSRVRNRFWTMDASEMISKETLRDVSFVDAMDMLDILSRRVQMQTDSDAVPTRFPYHDEDAGSDMERQSSIFQFEEGSLPGSFYVKQEDVSDEEEDNMREPMLGGGMTPPDSDESREEKREAGNAKSGSPPPFFPGGVASGPPPFVGSPKRIPGTTIVQAPSLNPMATGSAGGDFLPISPTASADSRHSGGVAGLYSSTPKENTFRAMLQDPNEPLLDSQLLKYMPIHIQYGRQITLKAMTDDGVGEHRLEEIVKYVELKKEYDKKKYNISVEAKAVTPAVAMPTEPKVPKGLESIIKIFKMFHGDEDKCRNKMRQDGIPQDRFEEIPEYFEAMKAYREALEKWEKEGKSASSADASVKALPKPQEPKMPKGLESCCRVYKMFRDENKVRNKMRQDGISEDRYDEIPEYFEAMEMYQEALSKWEKGIPAAPAPVKAPKPEEPKPPKGLEQVCRIYKMFKGDEDKVQNRMRQDGIPLSRYEEIPAYFAAVEQYQEALENWEKGGAGAPSGPPAKAPPPPPPLAPQIDKSLEKYVKIYTMFGKDENKVYNKMVENGVDPNLVEEVVAYVDARAEYEKKLAAYNKQHGGESTSKLESKSSKPEPPKGLEKYAKIWKMFKDEDKLRNAMVQGGEDTGRMQEVMDYVDALAAYNSGDGGSGAPAAAAKKEEKKEKKEKKSWNPFKKKKKKKPSATQLRNAKLEKSEFWSKCLEDNIKKFDGVTHDDEFLELFKKVDNRSLSKQATEKKKKKSAAKKKQFVQDPNLKKTLNILTQRINLPLERIRNAMWSFDEAVLTEDLLAAVIRGVPSAEEMQGILFAVEAYRQELKAEAPELNDSSIEKKMLRSMDKPSCFIYTLRNIPLCRKRLDFWMYINDFNNTVSSLKFSINTVTQTINTVRNSEGLRDIFTMLLAMARIYDPDHPEKYEKGFPMNMLFAVCKRQINDPEHPMTWVQFAVKKMMKDNMESLVWIEDLKCIDKCKKYLQLEQTEKLVKECLNTWNAIKNSLKMYKKKTITLDDGATDMYEEKLKHFVDETKQTMEKMKKGMLLLMEDAKKIATDFGEEALKDKKVNTDPLLEISKFREKCEEARNILEKERRKVERLRRVREKERERRIAFKKDAKAALVKISTASSADLSMPPPSPLDSKSNKDSLDINVSPAVPASDLRTSTSPGRSTMGVMDKMRQKRRLETLSSSRSIGPSGSSMIQPGPLLQKSASVDIDPRLSSTAGFTRQSFSVGKGSRGTLRRQMSRQSLFAGHSGGLAALTEVSHEGISLNVQSPLSSSNPPMLNMEPLSSPSASLTPRLGVQSYLDSPFLTDASLVTTEDMLLAHLSKFAPRKGGLRTAKRIFLMIQYFLEGDPTPRARSRKRRISKRARFSGRFASNLV